MKLNKILKNGFLIVVACLALSACATSKKSTGQMQGDVYTGTDTGGVSNVDGGPHGLRASFLARVSAERGVLFKSLLSFSVITITF